MLALLAEELPGLQAEEMLVTTQAARVAMADQKDAQRVIRNMELAAGLGIEKPIQRREEPEVDRDPEAARAYFEQMGIEVE